MRAARSLGHTCRLINVVGWRRYTGAWSGRLVRYLTDGFEPDFLVLTRHAIELGEPTVRSIVSGRTAVFWYFDLEPKEKVVQLGRLVDRMYVTYLPQVEAYRAAGVAQVGFLPQGVDPDVDVPAACTSAEYRCDMSFVGSGHSSTGTRCFGRWLR